ncbi:phage gp6-like head-tail connector protein [Salmonella enterica subsp. enterica serovar Agbeni]|uniref:Phage gp6-like head-tail connector protein n=1 Tax=Salmonella enterica subsp. enterica serovar Agbeni TaxID=1967642 RepID=A0A5X8MT24_SALET|nr:phage gp6-like head-tail connector protein [Salmonella enterica subsp. enterica serovar Agbeni]HCM2253987.1 phage gp6-like head-tail connector protein [Salmonella enterica subsp. enterica serovar Agbeni]
MSITGNKNLINITANDDELITLAEVKMHCRIDEDFDFEDSELTLLRSAALIACQRHIGKKIGVDLEWDNALKVGCLMYISHLYRDRSMVTPFEQTTVPLTVDSLWSVYRDPGVH